MPLAQPRTSLSMHREVGVRLAEQLGDLALHPLGQGGEAPAVEIAIASGPVRTIAGRMKLHSGGTSTTLTSIARRSASSYTRMLTSVSLVAAIAIRHPSRSPGSILAPLPGDRALGGERLERRMGLGGDERDLGIAGQQPLDLLQADVTAADDEATTAA